MYVKGQINVTTDVSVDVRKTDDPETGRQPSSTGSGEGFVDDCEMRPLATHGMAVSANNQTRWHSNDG